MIGARYGWILQYDIPLADFVHRVAAALYVVLTFIVIAYEAFRSKSQKKDLIWGVFGRSGYGWFTLLTTLLFIITGVILWQNHHANRAAMAFCMFVHEQLTYIVMASVIWHIYQKAHALQRSKLQIKGNIMSEPWFKYIVWFITSSFFFCVASIMISLASPEPSAARVGQFMTGMMKAMESSLMGIAAMEGTAFTQATMAKSMYLLVDILLAAFAVGIYRIWKDDT